MFLTVDVFSRDEFETIFPKSVLPLFGLNEVKICLGCWGFSAFGFIGCNYAIVIGCKCLWVIVMIEL